MELLLSEKSDGDLDLCRKWGQMVSPAVEYQASEENLRVVIPCETRAAEIIFKSP